MLFSLALDTLLEELDKLDWKLLEINENILFSPEGVEVLAADVELKEKKGVVVICELNLKRLFISGNPHEFLSKAGRIAGTHLVSSLKVDD
jgi:hypothetical protein